ncbi:MAG: FUSC family protein [Lachnospiraceae bacterium]|nr:FUSC family protein [Lachnospiraceae bacterium]
MCKRRFCYNIGMETQREYKDGNRDYKYGINVNKWCREHEQYVSRMMNEDLEAAELRQLRELHEKKLAWLMHERLIHLIVLLITVILTLFSLALLMFLPETAPASLVMFLIVFVLLIFYVRHYFFLENTVQRWYMTDEELSEKNPDT